MKWYKKQMDALKKDASKPPRDDATAAARPAAKTRGAGDFPNPVAQRNRNRSKTDSK